MTADHHSVLQRVRWLLEHSLNVTGASDETDLIKQDLLDSVGLVELLVAIEEEFGVQCELEDLNLDAVRSPKRIAALVEMQMARARAGDAA